MTLVFVFCFTFVLGNPRPHLLSTLLHSKPKVAQLSYWVIQWKELLHQQMGWWLNKPLGTPPQPLQRREVISPPLKITEPISTSFSSIPFSHNLPSTTLHPPMDARSKDWNGAESFPRLLWASNKDTLLSSPEGRKTPKDCGWEKRGLGPLGHKLETKWKLLSMMSIFI